MGFYTGIAGSGAVSAAVGGGASVRSSGADASGIRFGRFNTSTTDQITDGTLERAADEDGDGYRKQAATVNGTVRGGTGDAAGVYLAGGGKVFIGPRGTVGAASGVAVWARRKLNSDTAPALFIGLDPGGRGMAEVLDGGWILNDGGETTIVMNGVVLHDGTDGATGLWAPNGARDVTIRKAGVKVTIPSDSSDNWPHADNWDKSDPSESTVADRDFSAADFIVGEDYAPRAAVYEALPGFVLRLDGAAAALGAAGAKARTPGSPLWLRMGGGFGKYGASRADAGARYRFRRHEAEAGMDFPLAEDVTGHASVRLASGSAKVSSPAGGGRIDAMGHGLAAGAEWNDADGWFAAGRLSAMRYGLDVESGARGPLVSDARAGTVGYRAEAGRRLAAAGAADLTGRFWLDGARMSLGRFTDAVNSRVSVTDGNRLDAGAGIAGGDRADAGRRRRTGAARRIGRGVPHRRRERRRRFPARPCARKAPAPARCSAWARNGGPGTAAEPRSASTSRPAARAPKTPPTASASPCARRSDRPRPLDAAPPHPGPLPLEKGGEVKAQFVMAGRTGPALPGQPAKWPGHPPGQSPAGNDLLYRRPPSVDARVKHGHDGWCAPQMECVMAGPTGPALPGQPAKWPGHPRCSGLPGQAG